MGGGLSEVVKGSYLWGLQEGGRGRGILACKRKFKTSPTADGRETLLVVVGGVREKRGGRSQEKKKKERTFGGTRVFSKSERPGSLKSGGGKSIIVF